MHRLLPVLLLVACGSDPGPDVVVMPDAPAPPPPPAAKVVFLDFDGITLTAGPTDARFDTWGNLMSGQVVLPPYLDGDANRATRIAQIVDATKQRLASYNVNVVTARPASGEYHLVVFTTDSMSAGLNVSVAGFSQNYCVSGTEHSVSVQYRLGAGDANMTVDARANAVALYLGQAYAVPFTRRDFDCMCLTCTNPQPCTFHTAGTPTNTDTSCPGTPATVDVAMLFEQAVGKR